MKGKNLLYFMMPLIFSFSSCNKEEFFGEVDLNKNGTLDMIQGRHTSKGYSLYFFDGDLQDTNYIVKNLKYKAIFPHFGDYNQDGWIDIYYSLPGKQGLEDYVSINDKGEFKESKKLKE